MNISEMATLAFTNSRKASLKSNSIHPADLNRGTVDPSFTTEIRNILKFFLKFFKIIPIDIIAYLVYKHINIFVFRLPT